MASTATRWPPNGLHVARDVHAGARRQRGGGSIALRETFGEAASDIVIANTKGFTGHPMGVGVEDVIAVKILEHGIVPPVPNFKEVDPDLGALNLSRGGRYPVQYALHLAAGFGSQIAMTLTRRIPGALDRIDNKALYRSLAGRNQRLRPGRTGSRETRAAHQRRRGRRTTACHQHMALRHRTYPRAVEANGR